MLFDAPIPFQDAMDSRKVKALLPTQLSSGEYAQLGPQILERSLISARTSNAEYLQSISDTVDDLLNPRSEVRDGKPVTMGINLPTARLALKQKLAELNYTPEEGEEGTIKDLGSDKRINLVLNTNVQMAQGYGQWKQGQDPDLLDAFPAQELFRLESRKVPRDWLSRWQGAGGSLADGRMVALKNDPIWTDISAFGIPYPPFDYNSGMWTMDVPREEATSLGLIDDDTQLDPQDRGFNDDLKLTPDIRGAALISALVNLGYKFLEGVLSL